MRKLRDIDFLRFSRPVLLGLAGILTLWCLVSLLGGSGVSDELEGLLDRYSSHAKGDKAKAGDPKSAPAAQAAPSQQDEQVQRITNRNVFSPPKSTQYPPPIGVLGDAALFPGNQWVKVGESFQGAKLRQIGPDWVELEVDGKPTRLQVFSPSNRRGPGGPGETVMAGPDGMQAMPGGEKPRKSKSAGMMPTPEMMEQLNRLPPEERERSLRSLQTSRTAADQGS